MRSSKSRSRSKTSRPRTLGNVINRVFDSSGPEGKVRGTPAQLIEKYQFLARDAQLSNDRVAAENFLQHAEHYTRLLAEANREMAAEQESRQHYQQSNNQNGGNQNAGNQNGGNQNGGNQNGQNQQRDRPQGDRDQRNDQRGEHRNDQRGEQRDTRREDRPDYRAEFRDVAADEQPIITAHDIVDHVRYYDAGLVETPEAAPRPPRNDRPRYDRPRDEQRRPYPPRVDQQQAERAEKAAEHRQEPRSQEPRPVEARPVETRAPEAVVAQTAPKPKPAPKPAQPQAAAPVPTAEPVDAPKPRSRAPRKLAVKSDAAPIKATEE